MSFASFRLRIRSRGLTLLAGLGLGLVLALVVTAGVGRGDDRGAVFLSANPALAQHAAGGNGFSVATVAERALPSVVNIAMSRTVRAQQHPMFQHPMFRDFFGRGGQPAPERPQKGMGSGVIISADGLVVTNSHVVKSADKIMVVLNDKREFSATVVGTDPKSDLAVLKLKGASGLRPITLGNSDALRLGDGVLAIGNPFGVGQTVTMGIVSAKGRANMGIVDYEDFIQTDAAINPGNSGGALVNMRGELVGINTAILSRSGGYQGIGFAIPTNMMKPITDALVSGGKVVRGWLGVMIQPVDRDLAKMMKLPTHKGVLIADVDPRGPARKAGVKRGDLVVAINGKRVENTARLRLLVASLGTGKSAKLSLFRNGRKMNINVPLGVLPTDPRAPGVTPEEDPAEMIQGLKVLPLSRATRKAFKVPARVPHGVVVQGVDPNGGPGSAGLQRGDVILEVKRIRIKSVRQFKELYGKARGQVVLLVYRQGSIMFMLISK